MPNIKSYEISQIARPIVLFNYIKALYFGGNLPSLIQQVFPPAALNNLK